MHAVYSISGKLHMLRGTYYSSTIYIANIGTIYGIQTVKISFRFVNAHNKKKGIAKRIDENKILTDE